MNKKIYDFCFVMGEFPALHPSGGDNVTFQLAKGLSEAGYSVTLIIIKNSLKWLNTNVIRDSNLVYKNSFRRLGRNIFSFIRTRTTIRFLYPALRKLLHVDYDFHIIDGIDINLIKTPQSLTARFSKAVATWWGTAYFVSYETFPADKKIYLVQNSEDEVSFSGKLSHYANLSYNLPISKIVVNKELENRFKEHSAQRINIGFSKDFFKSINPLFKRDKKNVLLFLGRASYKGGKYAIEAARIIHQKMPTINLIAFGNMHSKEVPKFIEYYYKCSDKILLELYNRASIFIFPSLVEGFPLTVLEAMHCGCALVSTNINGVNELINDKENGLLVPIMDASSIAEETINLINDDEKRTKIAKNGILKASRYSYHNMVQEFLKAADKVSAQS